jgi:hypothetical protein
VNIDTKIPNKILINKFNNSSKRPCTRVMLGSSQECKDGLTYTSVNVMHHINRIKGKNHMITSMQKNLWMKLNIPFMIKALKKLGIEGHTS